MNTWISSITSEDSPITTQSEGKETNTHLYDVVRGIRPNVSIFLLSSFDGISLAQQLCARVDLYSNYVWTCVNINHGSGSKNHNNIARFMMIMNMIIIIVNRVQAVHVWLENAFVNCFQLLDFTLMFSLARCLFAFHSCECRLVFVVIQPRRYKLSL